MLAAYRTQTARLLQNPAAPTALYAQSDIDAWVNIARGQLAGESESIRLHAPLSTVIGTRSYNFSGLDVGTPATSGIRGVIHVSSLALTVGTGQRWLTPRPWPWFSLYNNNNPVPQNGVPTEWAQYGQGSSGQSTGSSATGSFYLDPTPDDVYTITANCVCYPIALIDDATIEALPYLWTDAVPFFAAYYALLSAQNNARMADAERYFNMYKMFVERARAAANPSTNRWIYSQGGDPAQAGKMQIKGAGG